nr:hypothetical protein [Tanacetum cinerariifolium]
CLGRQLSANPASKKGAAKEELIHASIAESYLWLLFKFCTLKENMRLLRSGLGALHEKAIVYPKIDTTDAMNAKILSSIEGVMKTYLSRDEAILMGKETSKTELLYPMEYLNIITFPSFSPYELQLKANMDVNNIDYFDPLLKPRTAYIISNFICEKTKPYQQTLENKISLRFRKITTFEVLTRKESEFPEHHFEFTAYNQLPSRVSYRDKDSKMIYLILTGCIRSISDITPSGDANTGQKYRRKVDIKNLDGNVVEFTMWDDLAKQFKKEEIEKLPRLVIVTVSSCRVSKYKASETKLQHNKMELTPGKTMRNRTRQPTSIPPKKIQLSNGHF